MFERQNKLDITYKLAIKINLFLFILVIFGLNEPNHWKPGCTIKGNQIIITSSSERFTVFVGTLYLIRTGPVLPILVDVRLMCGCNQSKFVVS